MTSGVQSKSKCNLDLIRKVLVDFYCSQEFVLGHRLSGIKNWGLDDRWCLREPSSGRFVLSTLWSPWNIFRIQILVKIIEIDLILFRLDRFIRFIILYLLINYNEIL